jgi:hypothetical protein
VYLAKPLVQFPMVLMQSRGTPFVVLRMVQDHESEIDFQLRMGSQQPLQNRGHRADLRCRPEPRQNALHLLKYPQQGAMFNCYGVGDFHG